MASDLIESRDAREKLAGRTEVLGKVKALSLLSDDTHATTEMVAAFYEVHPRSVRNVADRHPEELASNGRITIARSDLQGLGLRPNVGLTFGRGGKAALYTRRGILRVGMLLRDSDVAQSVRDYLQNVEELADAPQREVAADMAALMAQERAAVRRKRNLARLEVRADGGYVAEFFQKVAPAPKPLAPPSAPEAADPWLGTPAKWQLVADKYGAVTSSQGRDYLKDRHGAQVTAKDLEVALDRYGISPHRVRMGRYGSFRTWTLAALDKAHERLRAQPGVDLTPDDDYSERASR